MDLYLIHFPIPLKFVPIEKRYPPEWIHDPDTPELNKVLSKFVWREGGVSVCVCVCVFKCACVRERERERERGRVWVKEK